MGLSGSRPRRPGRFLAASMGLSGPRPRRPGGFLAASMGPCWVTAAASTCGSEPHDREPGRNGVPPDGCGCGIRRRIPILHPPGGTLTTRTISTTGAAGITDHPDPAPRQDPMAWCHLDSDSGFASTRRGQPSRGPDRRKRLSGSGSGPARRNSPMSVARWDPCGILLRIRARHEFFSAGLQSSAAVPSQPNAATTGASRRTSSGPARSGSETKTMLTPRSASSRYRLM